MKKFIGGMIFAALAYPMLLHCSSVIETAANVLITKLSVIMASDAKTLEEDDVCVSAIGFSAGEYTESDGEWEE